MADSRFSTGGAYTRIEHGWKWHTEQGTHYLFDNGDSAVADERADVDPLCVLQGQIEALQRRVAGQADVSNRVDRLEKRCTDLGHKADGAHTRIFAIGEKLDIHTKQINEHDQALLRAQCDPRLAQLNHPTLPACGNPACGQCYDQGPAKRAIKGGWVNVYLRDYGRQASLGLVHQSKADADRSFGSDHGDTRIACIQIPDITEGEGL